MDRIIEDLFFQHLFLQDIQVTMFLRIRGIFILGFVIVQFSFDDYQDSQSHDIALSDLLDN